MAVNHLKEFATENKIYALLVLSFSGQLLEKQTGEMKLLIYLKMFSGCPIILFCFCKIVWCDAMYFLSVCLNLHEKQHSIFLEEKLYMVGNET